jgi:hypothetical protein
MIPPTRARTLAFACLVVMAALDPSTTHAGLEAMPTRIDVDQLRCAELLALPPDRQERALVYLTGIVDGRRHAATFDASRAGAAVEGGRAAGRAQPTLVVLETLLAASSEAAR